MFGIETQKPPKLIEGFMSMSVVLLSCDSGETQTHGQWLKRFVSSRRVEILISNYFALDQFDFDKKSIWKVQILGQGFYTFLVFLKKTNLYK